MRIYSIPPARPFLKLLARAVLDGFPLTEGLRPGPGDLPNWTILVPTRRAAGELERVFYEEGGGVARLMPRIRPLGDVDEDLFGAEPGFSAAELDLPHAISPVGRELALMALIGEWAAANPQIRLAREIADSAQQLQALATSLAHFIDGLEIEEIGFDRIPELFGLESAGHREAILDFLALARVKLPALLHQWHLIGPMERRSRLLRLEARRLAEHPPAGPVIAAGSTGSIPATRALLKSIAGLPMGAVVLPGLDMYMSEEDWVSVGPQHPQYILKLLLAELGVTRADVTIFPQAASASRDWLASEIMRPAETAEGWREIVTVKREAIRGALAGVELVETRSRREEALAIALILRHALESPERTAALVTPDRELARRVKAELARWAIEIDDSAGEPLIRFSGAALLNLVLEAALTDFPAEALNALFSHPLCRFGMEPDAARRASRAIEIALFRNGYNGRGIADFAAAVQRCRGLSAADSHAHPLVRNLSDEDCNGMADFASRGAACLGPLSRRQTAPLLDHLHAIIETCEAVAGSALWQGAAGEELGSLADELFAAAPRLSDCSIACAAAILRHRMMTTPLRPRRPTHPRLAILGLLEARLVRPDIAVLGGLNEGIWPRRPDSGPWLNRPMRERLAMPQPERDIGQTAHDFVQAFGCDQAYLVWSRRIGDSPAIASRWILRLQMLMKSAGIAEKPGTDNPWQQWAAALDEPKSVTPCAKPLPKPPVEARPDRLSITRIETLIRDPYAIYARHVLGLQPLDEIAKAPDFALRGTLFHAALGDFFRRYPATLPADAGERLIEAGRRHFAPLMDDPQIAGFWWPRFLRIAQWLAANEPNLRAGVARVLAEIDGALTLDIAGRPFMLAGRADRIDLFSGGGARIVDFKTGSVPSAAQVKSGLAPQLTLEAALLESEAFAGAGATPASELVYIKLGGGEPPGEILPVNLKEPAADVARRHLSGLVDLLTAYARLQQPYIPRAIVKKEDEVRDYDHLSRYREWSLSGKAAP
ncbi:MAG: double-strand break repair protein AddB [Hyphomicrobiales bacterium]